MTIQTMPGITARMISTNRITTRVLFSGPEDYEPLAKLAFCGAWPVGGE